MSREQLVIGTRGSQLALWQAEAVRKALQEVTDIPIKIKVLSTRGDQQLELALHNHTLSKGLFTQELEEELLSGEIDFAVHSLKDLPVDMPEGLQLGGVLERVDVRDVVLLHQPQTTLTTLAGMRVGSSSPRRVAQLRASGLEIKGAQFDPIRGNVPTRIKKVRSGEYDATVLALAGLRRLGLEQEVEHILPLELMLPAPGQGAVAIQCATTNEMALGLAGEVNHHPTQMGTYVERQLLKILGGGCALPLGAYCEVLDNGRARLRLSYTSDLVRPLKRGDYEIGLGEELEEDLAKIAKELMA